MKSLIIALVLIFSSTVMKAAELAQKTRSLNGVNISYNYTSGRSYNVNMYGSIKGISGNAIANTLRKKSRVTKLFLVFFK